MVWVLGFLVALLAEGVGRNTYLGICIQGALASPSSRRAWVEMVSRAICGWNWTVALLAEGVGRNTGVHLLRWRDVVALLAEGVGRNGLGAQIHHHKAMSPSSRRAWVEIFRLLVHITPPDVALLAEGVGRNQLFADPSASTLQVALLAEGVGRNGWAGVYAAVRVQSPSSRRAWVEIEAAQKLHPAHPVALLAEGVGRNGSGLILPLQVRKSPSSRRAWVEIYPPLSA